MDSGAASGRDPRLSRPSRAAVCLRGTTGGDGRSLTRRPSRAPSPGPGQRGNDGDAAMSALDVDVDALCVASCSKTTELTSHTVHHVDFTNCETLVLKLSCQVGQGRVWSDA